MVLVFGELGVRAHAAFSNLEIKSADELFVEQLAHLSAYSFLEHGKEITAVPDSGKSISYPVSLLVVTISFVSQLHAGFHEYTRKPDERLADQ